jgi:hypothetical protein
VGTIVTSQKLIQEEIKRRLNSGNASYHSVQNLLPSCLLSKNIKIRIYRTIIKIVKIDMIDLAKAGLTEDLHRMHKEEFAITCCICDAYT